MSIDAIHIAKRAERAVLPLLTELLATENGKVLSEAKGDVLKAIDEQAQTLVQ